MTARDDYPPIPNGSKQSGGWGLLHLRMCAEIDRLRDLLAATEQSRFEWQRRALSNAISSFNEHAARRDEITNAADWDDDGEAP